MACSDAQLEPESRQEHEYLVKGCTDDALVTERHPTGVGQSRRGYPLLVPTAEMPSWPLALEQVAWPTTSTVR